MIKRYKLYVVWILGLALLVFGIFNVQQPNWLSHNETGDGWRVRLTERHCGPGPHVDTKEFRGGQHRNSLVTWLLSDCQGQDAVTYYAFDALLTGLLLTGISTYFAVKRR